MTRKDLIENFEMLDPDGMKAITKQKKPHLLYADINSRINPYNGDMEWKERLNSVSWSKVNIRNTFGPDIITLHDRLLEIGGVETCFPTFENDLDYILTYGQLWDNLTVNLRRGEPSQCHANSAKIWKKYQDSPDHKYAIVTGYALSTDGLWRQHSWILQIKPRANVLIETTAPRLAYYGFALPYAIAEDFCDDNY